MTDEDHTLGNALRYVLVRTPKVDFAGYSVPHPAENKLHIRVQTNGALFCVFAAVPHPHCVSLCVFICAGEPGQKVFREGIETLISICDHIEQTFDAAEQVYMQKQSDKSGKEEKGEGKDGKAKGKGKAKAKPQSEDALDETDD